MKPTITNQLGRGALLLALCIGLSGCVSNQIQTQGTITAVNASGQTIEIKTDEGQTQTVSVAANIVLYDGERLLKKRMTLDQIKAGNYLVVKQSPNPEGKLVADWGDVFNQRPTNLRGSGSVAPITGLTAGSTAAPTAGSTLGPSFKQMESIPADKAVVYIYRPSGPISSGEWFTGTGYAADIALPFPVKANGKLVTTLVKGGYATYLTEPGQIEFTAFDTGFMAPKSIFSITLDAKAGQAYYLKGAHGKGMAGRAHLTLVAPEVGANEITTCQLIP